MKKQNRCIFRIIPVVLIILIVSGCNATKATPEGATTATASPEEASQLETTSAAGEFVSQTCNLPLPTSEDWPILRCDSFEDNRNNWIIESQNNPYARYDADIQDGKYEVVYTAKGFAGYQRNALTWFDVASADDFALSVTTLMESDYQNCSWGVAFRRNESSFFLFSIYNDGSYAFEIYEDNTWISLISQRPYDGIELGVENTLSIVAKDQEFKFYINGIPVNDYNGGLLQGSDILLVVSAKEGVSANYYFDDLVLQGQ